MANGPAFGPVAPIQQPTALREAVYMAIRDAIILGRLRPGARLKERDLATQLGTSTTPIKEALRRLEQDGLLVTHSRRGAWVADGADMKGSETTLIRAFLEAVVGRLAAVKATDADLENLRGHLAEMEDALSNGEFQRLYGANTTFHQALRKVAGNPQLGAMIDSIRATEQTIRKAALSDPEEARRGYVEHRSIYDAIAARAPDLAEQRIRAHILRVVQVVLG